MTDYKILVQQILADGQNLTVWVSEIRDAATEDEAVERFMRARITEMIGTKIAEADAARQVTEDHANRLLNRNRLYVLAVMWAASLIVPYIALSVLHIPVLAFFAGSFGYTGAAMLTFYAWLRKY